MAEFELLLRTVGKAMFLPPGGPLLLIGAGLLLLRRRRRLGTSLTGTGAALLYLLATPITSAWLVQLASGYATPLDIEAARQAQAIVILGGGVRRNAPEYGGDTLGRLSLERVRYGAQVARATGLPILVSGGSVRGDTRAEAHLMRETLQEEFSLQVRWVEDQSRNTRENAERSAELLHASGVSQIVLVVHAFDVPRARDEFERSGLRILPAPTHVSRPDIERTVDVLPKPSALLDSRYAIYELIAQWFSFLRS